MATHAWGEARGGRGQRGIAQHEGTAEDVPRKTYRVAEPHVSVTCWSLVCVSVSSALCLWQCSVVWPGVRTAPPVC